MHKILVIEDDDPLRGAIASILQKNGFKVLEASNGNEGTKLARTQLPSLILCDLNMKGVGGSTLLAALRTDPITAHIPQILMTGQLEQTGVLHSRELGAEEWLAKPFTVASLLAAIQTRLRPEGKPRPRIGIAEGSLAFATSKLQKPRSVSRSAPEAAPENCPFKSSREQLEALAKRLQSLLEKERSWVARAIHDDLTQGLTVLVLELSLLNSNLGDPVEEMSLERCRKSVTKLSALVLEMIQSTQNISAELRPKVLDEFGLVAALEWLTQKFQKDTRIRCELRVADPDMILDAHVATQVYRLMQEILSNVAQYANASVVGVSLAERAGQLRLEVKDNGKGITARQINDPGSLGLLAMRKRMEHLRGEFSIVGRPNDGTTIVARIPMNPPSPGP